MSVIVEWLVDDPGRPGPVAVGVAPGPAHRAALTTAVEVAGMLGRPLIALHACPGVGFTTDPVVVRAHRRRHLEAATRLVARTQTVGTGSIGDPVGTEVVLVPRRSAPARLFRPARRPPDDDRSIRRAAQRAGAVLLVRAAERDTAPLTEASA